MLEQELVEPRPPFLQELAWSAPLRHGRVALRELLRATYRSRRPVVAARYELPELLNRRGLHGCGVEIGVKQGVFSEWFLESWSGCHLVSVDPWLEAPGHEYVDLSNVAQNEHDRYYAETQERLSRFGHRSTIWRQTGRDAAGRILHHSLDFAFLDARHDYQSVLDDLEDWFDKVRPGGVIAGHDYVDGRFADGDFGVRSAVDEFFRARGLSVHATFVDRPWISWFVFLDRRQRTRDPSA